MELKEFSREWIKCIEHDLGTKLEWRGIAHFDTGKPHVHVLIRGVRNDGSDLYLPRQYIREGARAEAERLATLELGPRTNKELKLSREQEGGTNSPEGEFLGRTRLG